MEELTTIGRTSTAATTSFCATPIYGPEDIHLWIDGNAKITAGNGSFEEPSPNAFSLVQIEDCPYSTPACEASCYVHELEKHEKPTHDLYRHNSRMIRSLLRMSATSWASVMAHWISENAAGGFRWHVSGDVFSDQYAQFIARVCALSPHVEHWIYTRSFKFVPSLIYAKNLAVNLSCDQDNYIAARMTYEKFPRRTRLCYLTIDGSFPSALPIGSILFPDYSLRGDGDDSWVGSLSNRDRKMVCPVDVFGKSETLRCGVCKKCLT